MGEEQRMLWMANEVYGPAGTSCSFKVCQGEWGEESTLALMKDAEACWTKSKAELVFDYLTKDL